eukprot:TRINITY_DN8724_c0_g2_i1.p1 TRINITY_DN8724_c0_g2~~TRINITY_DN8724_c0_g2_i1.p1  ORF type:complete len:424 (+),score=142.16 TRINITY_DN8724_c0_g2_i1:65-1336(+)
MSDKRTREKTNENEEEQEEEDVKKRRVAMEQGDVDILDEDEETGFVDDTEQLLGESGNGVATEVVESDGVTVVYTGSFVEFEHHGRGKLKVITEDTTWEFDGMFETGELKDGELIRLKKEEEGVITEGKVSMGAIEGIAEERDADSGVLMFCGRYEGNRRNGFGIMVVDGLGNGIVTVWDENGQMGSELALFVVCNSDFGLLGEINEHGEMSRMMQVRLKEKFMIADDVLMAEQGKKGGHSVQQLFDREQFDALCALWHQTPEDKKIFNADVSTATVISSHPLLVDPMEQELIIVHESNIEGLGLFAKRAIEKNTVVAWYNGVRVPQKEVDARDWKENNNAISLDSDEIAIDVPPNEFPFATYRASSGHFANHAAPNNNCEYRICWHPRFGDIKCVYAVKDVEEGEELCCDYGYGSDAPEWYQ